MKFILHTILILFLVLLAFSPVSCSPSEEQATLDRVETMIETHPDSAMTLLSAIDERRLSGKSQKAQYALLMSMALDKNYIDTATFDVLQPAIDYYLQKGTPDQKLRTFFYQGVIFINQGERDKAMNSFARALELSNNCKDSLAIARTLVAQGDQYRGLFDFDSYINCNLKAAEIYKKLDHHDYEVLCCLNVINGAALTGRKALGDSILGSIREFSSLNETQRRAVTSQKLSFALKFGSESEIRNLIQLQESNLASQEDMLNLALAYKEIGDNEKAIRMLGQISSSSQPYDTIRYLAILESALEGMSRYDEALSAYKNFSHRRDSITLAEFKQKVQTMEEKHLLEFKTRDDAQHKARIIWGCIGALAILSLGIVILLLLLRSNKSQKDLAVEKVKTSQLENRQLKADNELAVQKAKITELENERLKSEKHKTLQQAKITKLENESLKSEKEKLSLENRNLQLERDKKSLEAENLAHQVAALESESEALKALMSEKEVLPPEVQREITIRIEMLNALVARHITKDARHEKSYDIWIKELTDNKEEFMNSNRLAFQVSHPRFIRYLEDHTLTVDEINYVCLYAIGLRGKEVGNYIKKPGHVNTSSAIRKKLGIDRHETNISIYVRKLLKNL